MTIISSYAEIKQESLEAFQSAQKGSVWYELRRLVQEANANFGLQIVGLSAPSVFKPYAKFVTADGISCGGCSVVKETTRSDGNHEYRYFMNLPTIKKEKASANSDRDSRDSNSLSVLIRAIKRNKEEPTPSKLVEAFHDGMKYTMLAVRNSSRGKPRMGIDGDTALAMTRYILGIDSSLSTIYSSELKDRYNQFQLAMQSYETSVSDFHRYARGMTLVCVNTNDMKPHYLVCDATFDVNNEKFEIQGGLKRYNSLADSPIADLAVMIKTHFQGTSSYDQSNDLGMMSADKFYPEIDVSSGYMRSRELWVAIPKHGQ